jgi:predicted lysophospholipase L1 biosynthesis ABC-type transport system permease subunit
MIDVDRLVAAAAPSQEQGTVRRQIMLPWRDAFRIAIRNVTLRLARAAITASGVILGIAFLVSVWTTNVIMAVDQEEAVLAGATAKPAADIEAMDVQLTEQAADDTAARSAWLVVMSLLVCGVGITNSMLMSVTERFREIGTMKCLGALDAFIVRLFLIETAVLGLLGAFVGVIIGHVVMLVIYMIKLGPSITAKMDWGQMALYMLLALAIGSGISMLAAIPPAVRAARMPAAAALATEI